MLVKQHFQKMDGREMRHFIVSFDEDITPYDAYIMGRQIAAYYAHRYQIVFGVHDDTENLHIHFVFIRSALLTVLNTAAHTVICIN